MKNQPRFNYIITIHNKEDLIKDVLVSVLMCCRDNSFIYPILDGCTDRTEEIIDSIIEKYSDIPIKKIYAPDVHEILSINIGLKAASQEGEGFNIILQDDVILADFRLEEKIIKLYQWGGEKLGYVSLRIGANFIDDVVQSNDTVPQCDYIENIYGHGFANAEALVPGCFSYRDIAIKSPVCLPFRVVREVGLLEEKLAPCWHDDSEYAVRCYKAGYRNGVFAIKFYSDLKWGGTRKKPHPEMKNIIRRNIDNIRRWHKKDLLSMKDRKKDFRIYKILDAVDEKQNESALLSWQKKQKGLTESKKKSVSGLSKIRSIIAKIKKHGGMKILSKIKSYYCITNRVLQKLQYRGFKKDLNVDINFTEAMRRFEHPNKIYRYLHHYFYHLLPQGLRKHRFYFSQENRGFGEDAFHSMWWLLMREFKPKNCLEIGVYRGQTISLWSLIAERLQFDCSVSGISPFTVTGDSVSTYVNIDYLEDIEKSFKYFNVPRANLIKALSTDQDAKKYIRSKKWDLIYIDGNHDFDVVLADYKLCKESLAPNGILIFDDSSLYTSYVPPPFAFAGHPGPSKVVRDYAMKELEFLGSVGHNNIFKNKLHATKESAG